MIDEQMLSEILLLCFFINYSNLLLLDLTLFDSKECMVKFMQNKIDIFYNQRFFFNHLYKYINLQQCYQFAIQNNHQTLQNPINSQIYCYALINYQNIKCKIFQQSVLFLYVFFITLLKKLQKLFPEYYLNIMKQKNHSMNSFNSKNFNQTTSQCVCQICTCHKHKCPHSKLNIPFQQISTYQKQFHPHPFDANPKMCTDNHKYTYNPYNYINSSYREDYPGHKPQMRQKIVPRVKNQNKNIQFTGQSWYKSTYKPVSVQKDKLRNKDKQFNPCVQKFMNSTTYKDSFVPKRPQSQFKNPSTQINYPQGYKFDGHTTYTNDFIPKDFNSLPMFKPVDKVAPKGKHYLNSTYQVDFNQKKPVNICPVLTLPKYPSLISYPSQHVYLNTTSGQWQLNNK